MADSRIARRSAIVGAASVASIPRARAATRPPILFLHGNGDTAGLWITTMWRFETNGWPRDLLHAVDFRYPTARRVEDVPQPGTTSVAEEEAQLAEEIAAVRRRTGAAKVVLIAQSRGALVARLFVRNGGADQVEAMILCGGVNHGVLDSNTILVGSEFNATSAFLRRLNAGSLEVVAGVRTMTIRSTDLDKFAQPDGRAIGLPQVRGTGYDAPALRGAVNVAIPGLDHRETGYAPPAFAAMWRFLTGKAPRTLDVVAERRVTLSGKISGWLGDLPTNIGLPGVRLEVFAVDGMTGLRRGGPLLKQVTGDAGAWGPLHAAPDEYLEFAFAVPGLSATHIYRSPFPRSSSIVTMRPQRLAAGDAGKGAIVHLTRPRGYFGAGRDHVLLGGRIPPAIPRGVPAVSDVVLVCPSPPPSQAVTGQCNGETIAARTWPASDGHVSVIELTE